MNGTRAAETLSPRTPDQPMAFTPDEFLVAAPISGIAVLGAAPIVRRIAWRLRSRSSLWLHASVHAAVGAAVGALTILIVQAGFALWTDSAAPASTLFGYCLIAAALTSASAVVGWGLALRNARRWDRGRRTARRIQGWIDQDAAVEDAALDS